MAIYLGVGNSPRNVKEMYVGVSNSPREVKEVYVGSSGTPQCVYQSVPDFSIINQLKRFSVGSANVSVTPPLSIAGKDGTTSGTYMVVCGNYRMHGVNCTNYSRLRIHMYAYFSTTNSSKTPLYRMVVATVPTSSSSKMIEDLDYDSRLYNILTSSSYIEHRWVKPAQADATFTIDTTVVLSSTIISNGLDLYIAVSNSSGTDGYVNVEISDISLLE